MSNICFKKPTLEDRGAFLDMLDEWDEYGDFISPTVLDLGNDSYEEWLEKRKKDDVTEDVEIKVPQSIYFVYDEKDNIVGATAVRHAIGESNRLVGGHIAYGVRPTERNQGYAKEILKFAIQKLNEMGVDEILVTCPADNIASEKTILANGGEFERIIETKDQELFKRFWIKS